MTRCCFNWTPNFKNLTYWSLRCDPHAVLQDLSILTLDSGPRLTAGGCVKLTLCVTLRHAGPIGDGLASDPKRKACVLRVGNVSKDCILIAIAKVSHFVRFFCQANGWVLFTSHEPSQECQATSSSFVSSSILCALSALQCTHAATAYTVAGLRSNAADSEFGLGFLGSLSPSWTDSYAHQSSIPILRPLKTP